MDLGDHLYHFSDEKEIVIRSLHAGGQHFFVQNTNGMVYQFTKKISSLPYLPSI